ncbi:MAG: hypothetical protein WCH34_12270 [Bacteroidota bacterium]
MNTTLKIKNIVWTGILPNIEFDRYFFVKNNIFNESEILPNSQFGRIGTTQLFTTKYYLSSNIIANPTPGVPPINHLVLNSIDPSIKDDLINEKMISIIKSGEIIECTGLGINFNWFITLDFEETSHEIGKSFFYSNEIKLISRFFNTEDAEYGIYVSKDFKNSRLKLDVKPIIYQAIADPSVKNRGFNFAFNFHFDIVNKNDYSEVIEILKKYNDFKEESELIISIYK